MLKSNGCWTWRMAFRQLSGRWRSFLGRKSPQNDRRRSRGQYRPLYQEPLKFQCFPGEHVLGLPQFLKFVPSLSAHVYRVASCVLCVTHEHRCLRAGAVVMCVCMWGTGTYRANARCSRKAQFQSFVRMRNFRHTFKLHIRHCYIFKSQT